jgi:hypothetical protein
MLRRWEIYSIAPNMPKEKVQEMERRLLECQRHLPELLYSAVGYNQSPAGYDFAWEHAYESPESYQRYMVRPYHSNIIDRFLLNDSPERVVTDSDLDAGLVGYVCDGPAFYLPPGYARRLVLLRLKPGSADAVAAITQQSQAADPRTILSVFAENRFATRWMDGVNQIYTETTFTHIWEQGYAGLADAGTASTDWRVKAGPMIEKTLELWYTIKAGYGYEGLDGPHFSHRNAPAEH